MGALRGAIVSTDQDIAALERFNNEFRRSLLSYFGRRERDAGDLEDMVQEVFVRLLRRGNASTLEQQNLSAYVFETASSVLKDRRRRSVTRHTDAHIPFDREQHSAEDFSPEHVLLKRERLAQATAALLELPERTRVIFVLRRFEGIRFKDIAAQLGISVSAVEKHMQRAMLHLMRRMDRE